MVWCPHCAKSETHQDYNTGNVCCVNCGKVVSQVQYTDDPSFVKDSRGGTHRSGNDVRIGNAFSDSRQRTLEKGYVIISQLINRYGISNVYTPAKIFYEIAVERSFTKGRRTNQVAAACLYIACRVEEKQFLLIEFSSELGVSVYELGTVYLELCKQLSLQNHPFVQMPVDPSLYMHRYTDALIQGDGQKTVLNTALQLAVSMKSDWMQTGRKPGGICAAAIYVSSVLHGYNFSKTDVVRTVHICEATLTKRLIEFENTKAGSLTIEEFTEYASMEFSKERQIKMPGLKQVVCNHKNCEVQRGFGLCRNCYIDFCGGLDGSEPPAFQRAEMQRLANGSTSPVDFDHNENVTKENDTGGVHCASPTPKAPGNLDNNADTCESPNDASAPASVDETDTLSEIPDSEVSCYLNTKEESRFRKIIWEQMNQEYMQEQAAKEAASKLNTGTSEEAQKQKQKDKKRRAFEAQNSKPPETAEEAVGQHFKKKKIKINDVKLGHLFNAPPIPKKKSVDDDDDDVGDDGDNERNDGEGDEDNNDEWNDEEEMGGGYGYDDDYDANGYDYVEY